MVAGSLSRLSQAGERGGGRPDCPACGSPRARPAFAIRDHRFLRCRRCASLYLEDPPGGDRLSALYSDERYFANPEYGAGDYLGYRDYLADRAEIEEKVAQVLAQLERFVPPGRLLDVGAGPGLLLAAARARGWEPRGLDLNPWAAAWAREELGVEVDLGTLEAAGYEPSSFEAGTMMDLIEHVAEPAALLDEAARVIRPGGVLAVLTPDAGSFTTRALGRRWPEVQRAGEHLTLFSVAGLSALLTRHSFEPLGWHSIGKRSSLATLAADLSPIAPALARGVQWALAGRRLGERRIEFDPRAKFCLYARRASVPAARPHASTDPGPGTPPLRLPKRAGPAVERAVREELEHLAGARRLGDWMFDQFAGDVRGSVAEVGAGIGTFSARLLAAGAGRLLLLEPEPSCASELEFRFGAEPKVRVVREALPDAPSLGEAESDLVLCQNVLEHVDDDEAAVRTMARALRPGGRLALLVPAGPRLFGPLDLSYGHRRRYTRGRVEELLRGAGLAVLELRPFNLLGVPGWWVKNRRRGARVGPRSLAVYEALLPICRPLEDRLRPPWGLSLVARAERPGG
jgi:2-polyprenyl-3-methyl-5-hydroxy-6-metoxy-1,4-benzoquinol methylase